MNDKLMTWLVLSFIFMTLAIAGAALFLPSVSEAATVIGILVGGYVSLLGGGAVGAYATRRVREESARAEGPRTNREDGE